MYTKVFSLGILFLFISVMMPRVTHAQVFNGDVDSNGIVNVFDYNEVIRRFGNPFTIFEYNTVVANFGRSFASSPQQSGILVSPEELHRLPMSGSAWTAMNNAALSSWGAPDLTNQDLKHGINVLAAALVYARTDNEEMRAKARNGIITAKRTMDQPAEWQTANGVLSLGRQLGAYVFAADLIDLHTFDPAADSELRDWLSTIRTTDVGTHGRWRSLTFTCENSANNWGTFACPSRLAASLYLDDDQDVSRVAQIIKAWAGDRSAYPHDAPGRDGYFQPTLGWDTGGATWACNSTLWTAVNPSCTNSSVNLDGAIVEDISRGGTCCTAQSTGTMYSWEALQGVIVSTELLYRTGRFGNPYEWGNAAIKRAMDYLERNGWAMSSPGKYVPWLANARYHTVYPTVPATYGRILGWGDWLYSPQ